MIPGKLYQYIGNHSFSIFDSVAFQYMIQIDKNDIVLAIEHLDIYKCCNVLTADSKIGVMYYFPFHWREL